MAVIMQHTEYGNHNKKMIFRFFDILKNEVLEITNYGLPQIFVEFRLKIGFETIPPRN